MESNSGGSLRWVILGLITLLMGGFLAAVHTSSLSRQEEMMRGGFGYRGQPQAASPGASVAGAAGSSSSSSPAGSRAFSRKVSDLSDSLLSWLGGKSAGSSSASSAQRPPDDEGPASAERDPFEEFYGKYYAHNSGASSPPGGGFSSFGGASSSGASAPSAAPAQAAAQQPPAGAPAAETAMADQPRPGKPLFGGPLGRSGSRPPPLQASLPSGGLPGSPASASSRGGLPDLSSGQRGGYGPGAGAISGMRGSVAASALDDASSSLRHGAQGDYSAKMSQGAAAVASGSGGRPGAGGGAAPAPSAAGGGSSSGGDTSSPAPKPAAAPGGDKTAGGRKSAPVEDEPGGYGSYYSAASPEQAFMKSVAVERRNGEEGKYLAEADYKGMPENSLLKSGGMPAEYDDKDQQAAGQPAADTRSPDGSGETKGFSPGSKRAPRPPDPERFSDLTGERRTQLRERMHRFIRRFENRYGEMSDIFFTPCSDDRQLCEKHNLKEGYLTEATSSDAQLVLGLKYSHRRWRPYTVSVTLPGSVLSQEEDGGDTQGR